MNQDLTNAAFYVSKSVLVSSKEIGALATGAKVESATTPGTSNWTKITITWPDVVLTLNHMGDDEAELEKHLEGFVGYAWMLGEKKMTFELFEIIQRIYRTRHVFGITAEPSFDKAGKCAKLLKQLALNEKSLIFLNQGIYDDNFRLLLGPKNQKSKDAALPLFGSQTARKAATQKKLAERGIAVPENLCFTPADEELFLRSAQDVARRAIVLTAVAVKGEGLDSKTAMSLITDNKLEDYVSPREMEFLKNAAPTKQELVQASWRYECLWVMLWSLGHIEKLGEPSGPCDVKKAVTIIRDNIKNGFIEKAKLRKGTEILDAVDEVYRLHWAAVNARQKKVAPPKGLDGGVIMEWHYALNWLIRHMNQSWDDVQTDT